MRRFKTIHLNDFSSLTSVEMTHIMGGETNSTFHYYSITCPVHTLYEGKTISCKGNTGEKGSDWVKCVHTQPYPSEYQNCNGDKYIITVI